MNRHNEKNLPDKILSFCQKLKITSGEHLDEPVTVLPWQERFIRGSFRPGIETAALSIARGNGKTTVVSWLAAAVLSGPLMHRNSKVVVACASHDQGRGLHKAVVELLPDADDRKKWSIWRNQRYRILNVESGAELTVLGMNPGTSHGLIGTVLILADEVAQWPKGKRGEMWNALETTLGKSPGCRLMAIGTRPADPDNPFTKLLDGQADYRLEFRSRAGKTWYTPSAARVANPSIAHFPSLERTIRREASLAKGDPARLAAYRAYRLNQGVDEIELRNAVLTANEYSGLVVADGITSGTYVLGIDLSGGHALTAACAVFDDGYIDGFAMWQSSVDLKGRSERDDVDYRSMVRDGDLILSDGPTVNPDTVLYEAIARWGRPEVIVSDFFRLTELSFACDALGYSTDRDNLVLRRMGWRDGSEDLRLFRRAVASDAIRIRDSSLMRHSFMAARTVSDASGNEKLAKETERSTRGKDDLAAAVVIAVAEQNRQDNMPPSQSFLVHVPPAYGVY